MRLLKSYPLHPFIFAVSPILYIYSRNIIRLHFLMTARAFIVVLLLAGFGIVIFWIIARDWNRAALVTSLSLMLFIFYGQIVLLLHSQLDHNFLPLILFSFIAILSFGIWYLVRKLTDPTEASASLNFASLLLLLLFMLKVGHFEFVTYQSNVEAGGITQKLIPNSITSISQEQLPDIYYIILDGYTSAEKFAEYTGHDLDSFVQDLQQIGFYVASCSQSNYINTQHSVTSSFYLEYLNNILANNTILPTLDKSTLIQTLKLHDYQIIVFENWAEGLFGLQGDVRLSKNRNLIGNLSLLSGINDLELDLINTYLMRPISKIPYFDSFIPEMFNPRQNMHYEYYLQINYILYELPKIPSLEGPKFVYTHIIAPHTPYIFNPDGEFVSSGGSYLWNAEYLNSQLIPILISIIEKSDIPPIIIVQGDHGPKRGSTPEQRLAILNAFYIDQEITDQLYATITPINSFRLILNNYFHTQLPLLDDISYYQIRDKGIHLENNFRNATIVPNSCDNIK